VCVRERERERERDHQMLAESIVNITIKISLRSVSIVSFILHPMQ